APDDLFVDQSAFNRLTPSRRMAIASGCQGEAMAALNRVSLGTHRTLRAQEGDTVLLSARIIPGNERAIFHMVNHFYRRGAKVLTEQDAKIHVSGHARRQEIKTMIALTRPKRLVPIHGERRHLCAMRELAAEMKLPADCVHVMDRGEVLDITARSASVAGRLNVSRVMVDGRD